MKRGEIGDGCLYEIVRDEIQGPQLGVALRVPLRQHQGA